MDPSIRKAAKDKKGAQTMKNRIKPGAIVRIAEKWREPGEEKILFVALENTLNPVTNKMPRWLIQAINVPNMVIQPSENVEEEMIEFVCNPITEKEGASK